MKLGLKLTDTNRKRLILFSYSLLSLIPILVGVFCIQTYGVDVLYGDQWDLSQTLVLAKQSLLPIREFFILHNEHRIATSKLISSMLVRLFSPWNVKVEMMIGYAFSILTYGLVVMLISKQSQFFKGAKVSSQNLHLGGLSMVASSLLLFSPVQHENWLWGFQMPWFLVILCLVAAVFFLDVCLETATYWGFFAAIAACVIASFSLAHGLFVWAACLPMFLKPGLKRWIRASLGAVWLGSAALTGLIYLADYRKPASHPSTNLVFERPGLAIDFFLNQVGGTFGKIEIPNLILGLLLIVAYAIAVAYYFKSSPHLQAHCLPWLSIALFSIIFALITTAGRLGLGSHAALVSRYTTVSLLLPVCLINLSRIFLVSQKRLREYKFHTVGLLLLAGFLFSSFITGYEQGLAEARASSYARYRAKTCIELHDYLDPQLADECITKFAYPDPALPIEFLSLLRQHQLREEAPVWSFEAHQDFNSDYGQVSNAEILDTPNGDILSVSGWAFSAGHPGIVLLGNETEPDLFTLTEVRKRRRDIAEKLSSNQYLNSGWEIQVALDELPDTVRFLTAYLYDLEQREIYQLGQVPIADLRTKAVS
ncbi:MAG: hypothetical protein AAFR26_12015 [Cyanobacteria bacterium J06626_4]